MLEYIFLGIGLETLYFCLFLIISKNIKKRRVLFFSLLFLGYIVLKAILKFNVYFNILYAIYTYIIMKVLYKDTNITDLVMFTLSSLILMIVSLFSFIFICNFLKLDFIIAVYVNRTILFSILFLLRNNIRKIKIFLTRNWNTKRNKFVSSLTIRNLFIIAVNVSILVLNLCIIYAIS